MHSTRLVAFALAAVAATALLPGCTLLDDWHRGERHTYVGAYSWGFEVSAFRKCGSTESWWVTTSELSVSEELVSTYRDLTNDEMYHEVFVKVRGEVGPRGTYGHVGAYAREIEVSQVIEMRTLADGECMP